MRTLRKVMLGVSVSALALVVAGGVNAKADGSENAGASTGAAAPTAEINVDEQVLEVTPSGDVNNVFVSFDAVKKGDKLNAKPTWNLYDPDDPVVADLSTLNTAKDVYIAVKADDSKPNVYYIAKADKTKIKGTYNPKEGNVKFDGLPSGATVEYRTATGNWQPYTGAVAAAAGSESSVGGTSVDLSMYEQQGATLYFRVAPKEYTVGALESKADGKYKQAALTAGNLPSKEFKVKIAKKAKGPSVKVDYVKGAITKPTKETEIRIGGGTWAKFSTDAQGTLDLTTGGVALIRTAATDKKAASNPTVITYTLGDPADVSKVAVKFVAKAGGKGTIEITNNASVTYAVYEEGKEREGGKAKPLATIKASKTVKLAEKKIPADKDLTVVVAADAKTGAFQSAPTVLKTAAEIKAGLSTATAAPGSENAGSESAH